MCLGINTFGFYLALYINLNLLGVDAGHLLLDLLNLGHSLGHNILPTSNCDHVAVRWANLDISFISDPPDVGASLANDELVGLLDDEDLYLVAALNLLLGNLGIGFISDPPDVGATLTDDAIVGLLDSGDLDCYSEKLLEQLSWLYWQL